MGIFFPNLAESIDQMIDEVERLPDLDESIGFLAKLFGHTPRQPGFPGYLQEHLNVLALDDIPSSQRALSAARHSAMARAHPDRGGSHEEAIRVNRAYEELYHFLRYGR